MTFYWFPDSYSVIVTNRACTNLVRERAVPGADADDGDVVEAGGVRHRRRGELAEAGLRHHYRVNLRRNT